MSATARENGQNHATSSPSPRKSNALSSTRQSQSRTSAPMKALSA
jgi:hypothetical protein